MKKVLKYSTILSVAAIIAGTGVPAIADTGGYVRIKSMDSHWHKLGFNQIGCTKGATTNNAGCRLASELSDDSTAATDVLVHGKRENILKWDKDDGEGIIAGADYGFFRLEIEATYQEGDATAWRGHTITGGDVHQARIFGNLVIEPFELFELLGEFGGIDELVKYNPAHYGISPYAMYGYGVMGGLLENLTYNRTDVVGLDTTLHRSEGNYAGGATAAVNVGAGVNIGLDQLARGISGATGATLPEYFKLPVEFSIGYHWQVGLDELLWDSMDEELGISDGGLTYSVGLKW